MRALSLYCCEPEEHTALALIQMMYDYDWAGASRSLDKAQALDPGWTNTYLYRSFLLTWLGKHDSATAVVREAVHMNPDDIRSRQDVGRTLVLSRKFVEAEGEIRKAIVLQPKNFRLKLLLGDALIGDGTFADAIRELEAAQKLSPATTRITGFRIAAYARGGQRAHALALVDSLVALSDRQFVPALDIAIAYAGLGDADQTVSWLERGYDDRTLRPYIRDPIFDFVKQDARFGALLKKMNLDSTPLQSR
jgi:Flp pilus assembly protein TadD